MPVCKLGFFAVCTEYKGKPGKQRRKKKKVCFFSCSRLTPDNLNKFQISPGENSAAFSLPPSVSGLVPPDEPVNLRVSVLRFATLLPL